MVAQVLIPVSLQPKTRLSSSSKLHLRWSPFFGQQLLAGLTLVNCYRKTLLTWQMSFASWAQKQQNPLHCQAQAKLLWSKLLGYIISIACTSLTYSRSVKFVLRFWPKNKEDEIPWECAMVAISGAVCWSGAHTSLSSKGVGLPYCTPCFLEYSVLF